MSTSLNIRTQVFIPWEAANPAVYPVAPEGTSQEDWSRARFAAVMTAWPTGNNIAVSLNDEWACRFALYLRPPGQVLAEWSGSSGPAAMKVWPFSGVYDLVKLVQSCPVALAYNVGRACSQVLVPLENPQVNPAGRTPVPQTTGQRVGESIADVGIVRAVGLSPAIAETFGVNAASPTAPNVRMPGLFGLPWYVVAGIFAGGLAILTAAFGGKRR